MESKLSREEARLELLKLLQNAVGEQKDLLLYVDCLEEKCVLLEAENRRLKEAAARRSSAASTMNSRLKDALRE